LSKASANAGEPAYWDFVALTALAAIFGASFIFTRIAVRDIPPLTVVAARLLLAALAVLVVMKMRGQSLPAGNRVWIFICASAFFGNALPFALISWGQVKVDAGLTAIFMAVMPLMTILLAHFVTADERMNLYKLCGVVVGLLGVVVLIGWDKLGELGDEMVRQYAIALGAVSYAINAIVTKHLTAVPRYSMIAALLLVASMMMLPLSLWYEQPWQLHWSAMATWAIVFLALGPTAIATLLILVIVGRQGASFLSQINFMVPLFGVLFGAVFLHEVLAPNAWISLLLILSGIALSRGSFFSTNQRRQPSSEALNDRPTIKPNHKPNGPQFSTCVAR